MFTPITAAKGAAKCHTLFWRGGVFALLVFALLLSGFVGGGTGIAHASARLLPPTVSSQQADAAPALGAYNATPYIGWTGTNTAHNLNLMTYNSTTNVFGPVQMLAETTLAGSGPSLTAWNSTLYVAWRGTDNRLNVGQYNPANPSHLTNKVTLNERSTNAPAILGWPDHLYLSWRGMDGRLNIISSSNGSQFGSKVTYPFVIRTSPSLMGSDNSLFVAWEDMSVSSHIVIASSNDPSHPTNLTSVVTTTSTSLLPVGLASAGAPAPFVRVAWCTPGDAHIHVGLFTDTTVIRSAVDTAQTTSYGPALYPNSLPLVSWTGTDTAHRMNVISLPLSTPTQPVVPFTLMRMLDQQHGWALTASSILKTADGGRTWQDVTPSPFNALANPVAVFYNPLIAWVTITKPFGGGKAYQLIHTIDGGQTWTTQTAQINVQGIEVLDINFINTHEGWMEIDEGSGAGQQAAGIVHTTDGGMSWNLVSTSISPPEGVGFFSYSGHKTGLSFANSSTGWAGITTYGSKQSFAYVTHNGGITWTSQNLPFPISGKEVIGGTTPPIIFGQDIVMPALENGGFTLYLSSNGGATWRANPQVFPSGQSTTVGKDNIYVVDPTHAWAIDSQGVLYITTNGGQSWSFHSTLQNVSQFSFISPTTGWAYSGPSQKVPTLLTTTDGGQSWNKINYSIY